MVGKAIVIDAEGQRHEIALGDDGAAGLDLPAMPGSFPKMFSAKRNANKYMIGVHCGKVAPALTGSTGSGGRQWIAGQFGWTELARRCRRVAAV